MAWPSNSDHLLARRAICKSMNDTRLAIPHAIKAGLGKYARNQLIITSEFGPRLRFSKIFTDLPMTHETKGLVGTDRLIAYHQPRCARPARSRSYSAPSISPVVASSNIWPNEGRPSTDAAVQRSDRWIAREHWE